MVQGFHFRYSKQLLCTSILLITKQKTRRTWLQANSEREQIMCSLRTPRPIYRSTSRPTYRWICRSTYRPTLDRYVGRHRDRHFGRGVLVEHRSICRPICRPVCRPICRPMLDRYVGRYSGRHSADTLTVEYRSSVGGLSVECRWSIGRLSYNINQKFRLSVSDL